jgi:hypothetical protein
MRPKKRVLLYCADYDRRNDLAFVLRVRCPWAIIDTFRTVEELGDELRADFEFWGSRFGGVVLVAAGPGDRRGDGQRREHKEDDLAEQIDFDFLLQNPEVAARTVEVRCPTHDVRWSAMVTHRVFAGQIEKLTEAMKIAASRKRGPKPTPKVQLETQVA